MPQGVATVVYGLVILALFLLDRDRESRVSSALWIPVAWVLLAGSGMVSDWLEPARGMQSPDQYLEGSPLATSTIKPAVRSPVKMSASRGLPSRYWSGDCIPRAGTFLQLNGPILL